MFPGSPTEHERNVRALPCIVTGGKSTFHHAQGPSINRRLNSMGLSSRGIGQRGNGAALVLPLCAELHYFGPNAVDGGIGRATWESKFGSQAEMIDRVGAILGYDFWELHKLWLPPSKIVARRV